MVGALEWEMLTAMTALWVPFSPAFVFPIMPQGGKSRGQISACVVGTQGDADSKAPLGSSGTLAASSMGPAQPRGRRKSPGVARGLLVAA